MLKLIVFDLDGTLSVNPEFYRRVYSKTLEQVIAQKRGDKGLTMLQYCRETYNGKGELALSALNIPFREWAILLSNAALDLINLQSLLREQLCSLSAIKVVYTGSPKKMACGILKQLGFSPAKDFDLIIGWQEPEYFPLKWSCSSFIFQGILNRFSVNPSEALAVGDQWDTDLMPAQAIGMKTAMIKNTGKTANETPDISYPSVELLLHSVRRINHV